MRRPRNRVLMLLENSPYPQDPRVRREATALTEVGYQVSVIAPARRGQPWRESLDGVRVYRYPAPRPGDGLLGYLWEYGYSMVATLALSLLALFRPGFDIIHAANPPDTLAFIAAAYKLLGKKFVYDHHDLAPEMYHARFGGKGNPHLYRALVWLERLSYLLADQVIVPNESYRAVAVDRGRLPEDRITVVRNGPDLDRIRAATVDPILRQKGEILIGFAGVMGSQDGVDYLLRALHHLAYRLDRRDFFCVIIGGSGDARESLKRLATDLRLDPFVWFTGWVSDEEWVRYLSTVDICVDPDPSNPFNDRSTMIKIMEYMAVGKPIVAFDLPEHRLTARDAALYVRPNDEMEMARALAQLMDDPARRAAMGAHGRKRVEDLLEWRHSVPHLLAAYRKLLPQPETAPHKRRAA